MSYMSVAGEDLKELTQIWYKKLKEHGFEDIEDTSHPESPIKDWHKFKALRRFKNDPNKLHFTTQYYTQAQNLLHTYNFDSPLHKKIWELHCEGFSKRKIEKAIAHFKPTYKREHIGNIIKLIAAEIII